MEYRDKIAVFKMKQIICGLKQGLNKVELFFYVIKR